ncbi:tyrosine-type recombinase/integrase [Schinkia sp. CFF1]
MAAGNIEERGKNTYRLTVSGGYDGQGKRIKYRKTITVSSRRKAEKELAKFVAEVANGQFIQPVKQTLKEFAEFWLDTYAKKNLKVSTSHGYEQMLKTRVYPALGHIPLDKLKPLHLQQFYSNLQEDGTRLDGKKGGLSARTVKHYHNCISSILQDAVEWQVLSINIAHNVKPPKPTEVEADFYTEEEVKAILCVIKDENFKYYVLFSLAITTGLRKGELLGLEWSNIDFENKQLEVKKTIMYRHGIGVYEDTPKSKSSKRTLSLSDTEVSLLQKYKEFQDKQKEELNGIWQDHDKLFTQWDGKPLHPNTPNNTFKKILEKHNLPIKNFHTLRHTNITLLLANNVDLKTVISRAGHQDGTLTLNRYGHALKSKDRHAAEKMDQILKSAID